MAKSENGDRGENKSGNDRNQDKAKVGFSYTPELLELLGKLFSSEGALEKAIFAMREGRPGWEVAARKLLTERLAEVLGSVLNQKRLETDIANLVSKFDKLENAVAGYQSKLTVHLADILPESNVKARFLEEYPEEKRRIASYLCDQYFGSPQRCFLQASTFVLHLAELLREKNLGRGSVFHTNSTIFPWFMLGGDSRYSVYACCGDIHDPLCAGWLFSPHDEEARAYVEGLFRRQNAPLNMAIVTPQHITLDGCLIFAMEETAELVQALSRHAKRLIITSPTERVRKCSRELSNQSHIWRCVNLRECRSGIEGGSIQFVLAGKNHPTVTSEDLSKLNPLGELVVL